MSILHPNGKAVVASRPLVMIGVPCGDRVHSEFTECMWAVARSARNHRQGICFGRSSIVANGRNMCVQGALQNDANYLMFIDSDMTFPGEAIDTLLAHKKDIVGCTYRRRGPPFDNHGHAVAGRGVTVNSGLIEMTHMPTGFLLIKMSVFAALRRPYFRFETNEIDGIVRGEDYVFSEMARAAGFQIWCDVDLSKQLTHIYQYHLRCEDPTLDELHREYTKASEAPMAANGR